MSKSEKERSKAIQEKCVSILNQLLKEEDNKYCVDCDAKGPRWASWNLGVFLCIRCAGIHRNLGVHISKVKSVNLDAWTPEQVGSLQSMGNSKGRAVYEANLPDNFRRPASDSALETFIRAKYELKKYIAKEWVPSSPKPAFSVEDMKKKTDKRKTRTNTTPILKTTNAPVARPKATDTPKDVPQKQESVLSSNDLLGLDSGQTKQTNQEDMFGLFVGGPTASSFPPQTNASVSATSSVPSTNDTISVPSSKSSQEEDFFKQSTDPASIKMSKESIMSLFGSGTSNSNQQVYGMPGGVYVGGGQVPYVPPQGSQNGMIMNSGYSGIPNGIAPNVGMVAHPGQMNPALQQPGAGMGLNPFMGNASVPSQQGRIPGNLMANQNDVNNASQVFGTNTPQKQNLLFDTNDLIGWNVSNMPISTPMYNQHPQLHHTMAAMQLSGNQPAQGWGMNPGPGKIMSVPQDKVWIPQQTSVGAMPVQGQTLSNNLWK